MSLQSIQNCSQEDVNSIETKLDENGLSYIEVSCGGISGGLYKGMEKCILYNGKMIAPRKFEALGGKRACKAWKKSIKHKNKPLSKFLTSGALKEYEPSSSGTPLQGVDSTGQIGLKVDMDKMFADLETKLAKSIERVVRSTMAAFKSSFESEINALAEKVKDLDSRVSHLEWNMSSARNDTSPSECHKELKDMQSQINQITEVMNTQQWILELKEREKRANNLVVVGLNEDEENEDIPTLLSEFLCTKMKLTSVNITQARRLGKKARENNKPRPILMTLGSHLDKTTVTANRSKLSGTRVYINNDLTKEQRQTERKLRETKKKLTQHPDFRGKKFPYFEISFGLTVP